MAKGNRETMINFFDEKEIITATIIYIIMLVCLILNGKKDIYFLIFSSLLFVYLVLVIKNTQFPIMNAEEERQIIGPTFWQYNLNIIPFKGIMNMTALLNVIMTVPFGFLLPMVFKIGIKKIAAIGLSLGIAIEGCQAVIAFIFGYSFRIIDINDVICNWVGG